MHSLHSAHCSVANGYLCAKEEMPEIGIYRMEMNIMIIMLISAYSYSVDLPPAALAYEFNFIKFKKI